MAVLRLKRHQGKDSLAQNLKIDCHYECFGRQPTPPLPTGKQNKEPPVGKIRRTPLQEPQAKNSLDDNKVEEEEDDFFSSSREETPVPKPRNSTSKRDSVTKRKLMVKKARDKKLLKIEQIRKTLYSLHRCDDSRCDNFKATCFVLKSAKTHHRISIPRQIEWAECIDASLPSVTTSTPPTEWLVAFAEGESLTSMKKAVKKKEESSTTPALETSKPVEVHNHFGGQPAPVSQPLGFGYTPQIGAMLIPNGMGGFQIVSGDDQYI